MLGWIQATMQQNTIFAFRGTEYSCFIVLQMCNVIGLKEWIVGRDQNVTLMTKTAMRRIKLYKF